MSRRLRLTLSFDGARFAGFRVQPDLRTVQGALTDAWRTLTREDVTVVGCSRLDAKVSAYRYFAHLDSAASRPAHDLMHSLNGVLRTAGCGDIGILAIDDVEPAFHARFGASGKHYRYLLWHGNGIQSALTRRAWRVTRKESPYPGLADALRGIEGRHDFAAFRGQNCTARTTEREIRRVDCWAHPMFAEMRIIDVWGDGFLKHMIRNLVGSAVDASHGRIPADALRTALTHSQRTLLGQCAPGHGLTLMDVFYDRDDLTRAAARGARDMTPC